MGKLYNPWDPSFGSFSLADGFGNYAFTGTRDNFVILRTYDEGGIPTGIYVASRDEVELMDEKGVTLESGNFTNYCGTSEDRGEKVDTGELERVLPEMAPALRGAEEENSVQTEGEAKIASDNDLIARIQKIYQESTCKEIMKEKIDLVHLTKMPKFGAQGNVIGQEPLVQTTYMCVRGDLIPEIIVWEPKLLIICSRAHVKYKSVKKFMYENLQKSSKTSMGIGASLGSPAGYSYGGPEVGKPVYSHGKPMTGSGGLGINFSYESCKQYSRLSITAEMRMIVDIGGYEILKVPRT